MSYAHKGDSEFLINAHQTVGRQLETTVHTSLPPLVKGYLRGHLVVSLEGGVVWEYSVGPPTPKLCVQLKWWGERSPGTIFRYYVHLYTIFWLVYCELDCGDVSIC